MSDKAEPAKLPPMYLNPIAGHMTEGQRGLFALDAMIVDLDGSAWIDPYAQPLGDVDPTMLATLAEQNRGALHLTRKAGGFQVGLYGVGNRRWTPSPKRADAATLIPVVDFEN